MPVAAKASAPIRAAPRRERAPARGFPATRAADPTTTPLAQRAPGTHVPCACGGTCPRCQRTPSPASATATRNAPPSTRRAAVSAQPALPTIENDALEQEATAVAQHVLAMAVPPSDPPPPPASPPAFPSSSASGFVRTPRAHHPERNSDRGLLREKRDVRIRRHAKPPCSFEQGYSATRSASWLVPKLGVNQPDGMAPDLEHLPRHRDHVTQARAPPALPISRRFSTIRATPLPLSALALGAGLPIADPWRRWFEERFQIDFSAVRLHRGPLAAQLAAQHRARAFTYGSHIVLGSEVPALDAPDGRLVLAHELTHTLQQAGPYARGDLSVQSLPRGPPSCAGQIRVRQHTAALGVQCLDLGLPGLDDVTGAVVEFGEGAWDAAAGAGEVVLGAATNTLAGAVDFFAPGLMPFLTGGYAGQLTDLFCSGLDSLVGALISPLEEIDIVSAIEETFSSLTAGVNRLQAGIGSTASAALGTLLRPIVEALQVYGDPIVQNIAAVAETVEGVFSSIWENVGVPVLDFLGSVGGAIWTGFNDLLTWLERVTEPLRRHAEWAWNELCDQFNLAWNSTGGIRKWFSDTAQVVWDTFLETIEPIRTPLMIVGGALLLLSPFGPIIVITQVLPPIYDKLVWLWNNWNTDDILVQARVILEREILPGILDTVSGAAMAIAGAVSWLAGITETLSRQFGDVLGAFGANRCLTAVTRVLTHISNQYQRLAVWAKGGFKGLGDAITAVFNALVAIFQPILDFLVRLAMVAANPGMLPIAITAAIWLLCPDDLKPPVINFVLDLLIVFLRALPAFLPGLWPMASLMKSAALGFLASLRIQTDELKIAATNKIAGLMAGGGIAFIAGFALGLLEGIIDGILDPFVIIWMLIRLTIAACRAIGTLLARLSPTIAGEGARVRTALGAPAPNPSLGIGGAFMSDLGFGETQPPPPSGHEAPAATGPPAAQAAEAAAPATSAAPAATSAPAAQTEGPQIVSHEGNAEFARIAGIGASPAAASGGAEAGDPADLLAGGPVPSDAEIAASLSPDLAGELSSSADALDGADAEGEQGLAAAVDSTGGSPRSLSQMLGEAWDAALAGAANLGASIAEALLRFILLPNFELGRKIGWVGGFVLFQVILAYFTAGISTAGQAASPTLRLIVRFLDLGGEILGLVGRGLGRLAGPITRVLSGAGDIVRRIPGLGGIFSRFSRAIRSLLRFSAEAGGAAITRVRRVTDPMGERALRAAGLPESAIADVVGHGATGAATRTTAEATERGAAAVAEETTERVSREAAEESAERAARESTEDAAQEARRASSESGDAAGREATHADDAERAAAREGDEAADLARRRDAEILGATAELQLFCEANDRVDTPVPLLIAELYAIFRPQYPWIRRFFSRARGGPGQYAIFFEASPPHEIDGNYTVTGAPTGGAATADETGVVFHEPPAAPVVEHRPLGRGAQGEPLTPGAPAAGPAVARDAAERRIDDMVDEFEGVIAGDEALTHRLEALEDLAARDPERALQEAAEFERDLQRLSGSEPPVRATEDTSPVGAPVTRPGPEGVADEAADQGLRPIDRPAGAPPIESGVRGDIGEVRQAGEVVGQTPPRSTRVLSQATQADLREQLLRGDITLREFVEAFRREEGVAQVFMPTQHGGRYVDHMFVEGGTVVLRESKNVRVFGLTEDYALQLRKDLDILNRFPDARVEWRISGDIDAAALDHLRQLAAENPGRFTFVLDSPGPYAFVDGRFVVPSGTPAVEHVSRFAIGPAPERTPSIVHRVLAQPGQPLPSTVRAKMEPALGGDFRGVRLHTGPLAAASARAVNARAYEVGGRRVHYQVEIEPGIIPGSQLPNTAAGAPPGGYCVKIRARIVDADTGAPLATQEAWARVPTKTGANAPTSPGSPITPPPPPTPAPAPDPSPTPPAALPGSNAPSLPAPQLSGSQVAQQRGFPPAEPGYHWAMINGTLVHRRNWNNPGPQRVYDPTTRTFSNKVDPVTSPQIAQEAGRIQEKVVTAITGWPKNEKSYPTAFGDRKPDYLVKSDPASGKWKTVTNPSDAHFVADSKYYDQTTVQLDDQIKGFIELATRTSPPSGKHYLILVTNESARISDDILAWARNAGVTVVQVKQKRSR